MGHIHLMGLVRCRVWIPFSASVAGILMLGCSNAPGLSEAQFSTLFSGFELIWIGQANDLALIGDGVVRIGQRRRGETVRVMPGNAYGFRYATDENDARLALQVIPDRLRRVGAQITKAPKSTADLVVAAMGGPYFTIEFELEGHPGRLFNRLVAHQSEGEAGQEVLVLVYR